MNTRGNDNGKATILDERLWAIVTGVCLALGGWGLSNMQAAIEREREAREALTVTIQNTYVTKDTIAMITSNRERQLQLMIDQIKRNTAIIDEMKSDLDILTRMEAVDHGRPLGGAR